MSQLLTFISRLLAHSLNSVPRDPIMVEVLLFADLQKSQVYRITLHKQNPVLVSLRAHRRRSKVKVEARDLGGKNCECRTYRLPEERGGHPFIIPRYLPYHQISSPLV